MTEILMSRLMLQKEILEDLILDNLCIYTYTHGQKDVTHNRERNKHTWGRDLLAKGPRCEQREYIITMSSCLGRFSERLADSTQ